MTSLLKRTYLLWLAICLLACGPSPSETPSGAFPEWAHDAVVYQVNIQDFTPEGTLQALELHLPRLEQLGVEVLWLSPIFPTADQPSTTFFGPQSLMTSHHTLNPAYGSEAELKAFIRAAHDKGMRVMLTWEAQCTSSEHPLLAEHPEWFIDTDSLKRKGFGLLDLTLPAVIDYHIDALSHWTREFGIDGYYFQHAGQVPPDFWTAFRDQVSQLRPLLTIADVLTDANRSFIHVVDENQVLVTAKQANEGVLLNPHTSKPGDEEPLSLNYTSSMLINARQGSVFERLGPAARLWAAYSYLAPGMPMIYSGQEVGLKVALSESKKDTIRWGDHPFNSFYDRLNKLRKDHPALWLTPAKTAQRLRSSADGQVTAFLHGNGDNYVLGIFNRSDKPVDFRLLDSFPSGSYKSFNSRAGITLGQDDTFQLGPYGFEIYTLKP